MPNTEYFIRKAKLEDASSICRIYNYYVEHTIVTFDLELKEVSDFKKEMDFILNNYPYFVAEHNGKVIGYAYANAWKARRAYSKCVELSIYLDHLVLRQGIGKTLYIKLIETLRNSGFHSVIGGVSLPNETSVKLHENLGFKKVAHFTEVGFKFDNWIDVAYWELILD